MFYADYFDGKTSTRHRVTVIVVDGMLRIKGDQILVKMARAEANLQSRIGDTPARIELPNNGLLVAHAEYSAVSHELGAVAVKTLAHRLESNLGVVFASLIGLIVAGWFVYKDGIPLAARHVAESMPVGVEREIGRYGLESLDKIAFSPSRLTAERKAKIQAGFGELVAKTKLPAGVRLEFRQGGWIDANALALPGQIVVITDQLVEVLGSTDRALAVLAHELGHVERRHGLRRLLESSMVGLATFVIWGDASSVAAVAATLPTALVHAGYSRDAESEADEYAFELLKQTGRAPALFAEAMDAMEAHYAAKARSAADEPETKSKQRRSLGYFSTHPDSEDRSARARAAAGTP